MSSPFHKVPQLPSSSTPATTDTVDPDQFPEGLRILIVDDDVATLKVLERMSLQCNYQVTTCGGPTAALDLLREKKDSFDVVLSDVHMPGMDGYKFLEIVKHEMDLPFVMMSADCTTSAMTKGLSLGARHYFIKPVLPQDLRNIWQFAVKKGAKVKEQKKRSGSEEDDDVEILNMDDLTTMKKPRVMWTLELHNHFVSAVQQLGMDRAVPNRILQIMNVPGLTRENIASHLQKFRMYLRRFNPDTRKPKDMSITVPGTRKSRLGTLGVFDMQVLAPETLAAIQADLIGQQQQQVKVTGADSVGYGAQLPSNPIGSVGPYSRFGMAGVQNNNMPMDMWNQQRQQQRRHQQQLLQQQQQAMVHNQSCPINVQSSFLGAHSLSPSSFNMVNNPPPAATIQQVQNSTMAFGNGRPMPGLMPYNSQIQYGTGSGLGDLGFVNASTNGSTWMEEPNSVNGSGVSHNVFQI
ncbi:hypothetical protein RIF29_15225 [Crotalaria pallida]|uniref:Response regulatory domain-containing protein n=1 Tax=Crotalaria pallida TaxID=3830 RepID=A0AAN9IB06_CROPI